MTEIECKNLRNDIMDKLALEIASLKKKPCLAVILVGNNPASQVYVKNKKEACEKLGIVNLEKRFEESIKEEELIDYIQELNKDDSVSGILVQLPLPSHISEHNVINTISPSKDVDGFSPINLGKLLLGERSYIPCTPLGIVEILKRYYPDLEGKNVVILGRSNIVGKPIANLLLQKEFNATVTVCHSKTKNLTDITKRADVLIVAIGRPFFLKANMTKSDAFIIDVGINRVEDASKKKGYRIVGDVDIDSFKDTDCSITKVPGGVGLMTVAMLMKNTVQSCY